MIEDIDWSLMDSEGPQDDMETLQTVNMEESEIVDPDVALAIEGIQDVTA